MKGDFSRLTFDPAKQFSRVLMQQGRVQLDADWNEQSSLLLHYLRELARALVGPHGGTDAGSFKISKGTENRVLDIGRGTYFVEGIMCVNDGKLVFTPPDSWETKDDKTVERPPGDYLVYLHVVERHVTFVNDSDIRERALGDGVDTATRTKVVCSVSAVKSDLLGDRDATRVTTGEGVVGADGAVGGRDGAAVDEDAVNEALEDVLPGGDRPTMRASTAKSDTNPHDICNVPPFAEYRGANNQLYRVEIHDPSKDGKGATFKWSRENGSVVFPVLEEANGRRLVIERYGRDGRHTLRKGDWVEFEDDDLVAAGRARNLARVESVDADTVTLDTAPPDKFGADAAKHPLLRRWDHATYPAGAKYFDKGVIKIEADDKTYPLENGIEVTFKADGGDYRRGDYWVIPARTAGGDIDWPADAFLESRRADEGVAPLAVITVANNEIGPNVTDLRKRIKPVAVPAGT